MPKNLTEYESFDSNIQVPQNGDKNYAEVVESSFQKLANRTTWLKNAQLNGVVGPAGEPGATGPQGPAGVAGFSTINGLSNPGGSITINGGNNISITDNGNDTITISSTASISGNFDNYLLKSGDMMTGNLEFDDQSREVISSQVSWGGNYLVLNPNTASFTNYSGNGNSNYGITFSQTGINHDALGDVAWANDLSNYVAKSGDTMTGDLTISNIAGGSESIVTVDNTGKLVNSGISPTEFSNYVAKAGDTMSGILEVPYLKVNETAIGPLPTIELQASSSTVSSIRGISEGIEVLDSSNTNIATIDNTGVTIAPLAGNDGQIVTLTSEGKLISSGVTVADISGGGGGNGITVVYDTTTINGVSTINFTGSAVTSLVDNGGGEATITIESTSGGSESIWAVTSITGNAFTPDELSNAFSYTLNNHATLYCPTTMQNGESKTIRIIQSSPSVYSLSFANSSPFVWKFSNGAAPVITSTAGAIDILTILRIDNDIYVTIIKNFLEST